MAQTLVSSPHDDDIVYPHAIPFILVHLACFAAIWTGVPPSALLLALVLYVARMFGITAGFHRYFSHRSFKTSRSFQFFLAFLAQTSAQRGVLWWASRHREHHKHSDQPEDVHSPHQHGLFFSHIGWVYAKHRGESDYSNVKDLTKFPELAWLDKHIHFPAFLLALGCYLWMGWAGLVVGFLWSTVALYHGTFAINSLAHVWGRKRYFTGDESRNNFFLALVTMGEGWHNNHHYFMGSARQGFRWWEFDPTYWILRLLAVFRVVWDIQEPSAVVVRGERRLSHAHIRAAAERVVETVKRQSVPLTELPARVRAEAERLVGASPSLAEVVDRALASLGGAQPAPASS
jgi:stearoyl-CoA desaturase (delta-9 desaturase)